MNDKRHVFIFQYGKRGWMVVCYWSPKDNKPAYANPEYFNCDEHSWDDAMTFVDAFLREGDNKYCYTLPSYECLYDILEGEDKADDEVIDIFELHDNKPIEELADYLDSENSILT